MRKRLSVTALAALILIITGSAAYALDLWAHEWPVTDFENRSIDLDEILSGGPPKDGIPSIDNPVFAPAAAIDDLPDLEPVISVEVDGQARAYPLRILMWHEIVNDKVNGVPLTITPLVQHRHCVRARNRRRRVRLWNDGQTAQFRPGHV